MDEALKCQIIEWINKDFIDELKDLYTGYMGITARDMLDHLMDRY